MSQSNKPVFTEQQAKFIIEKFIKTRQAKGLEAPSEEECIQLVRWAEATMVNFAYLDFVMRDMLNIDMQEDGLPFFENPNFVPPQEMMSNKELFKNRKFINEGTEILKEMTKHLEK